VLFRPSFSLEITSPLTLTTVRLSVLFSRFSPLPGSFPQFVLILDYSVCYCSRPAMRSFVYFPGLCSGLLTKKLFRLRAGPGMCFDFVVLVLQEFRPHLFTCGPVYHRDLHHLGLLPGLSRSKGPCVIFFFFSPSALPLASPPFLLFCEKVASIQNIFPPFIGLS